MFRLYLANFPKSILEDDLHSMLRPYGQISNVVILTDGTGRSRGAGFASFADRDDGVRAVDALNNGTWGGQQIQAREARER